MMEGNEIINASDYNKEFKDWGKQKVVRAKAYELHNVTILFVVPIKKCFSNKYWYRSLYYHNWKV